MSTAPRDDGIDLIFMIDESVNDRIFDWMKDFLNDMTQQIDIDSREFQVGAMTFGSTSTPQFQLKRSACLFFILL